MRNKEAPYSSVRVVTIDVLAILPSRRRFVLHGALETQPFTVSSIRTKLCVLSAHVALAIRAKRPVDNSNAADFLRSQSRCRRAALLSIHDTTVQSSDSMSV